MERLRRLPRSRPVTVAGGLLLLLVPTLFSVFPAWSQWSPSLLVVVVGGWFSVAWFVVASTARQGEKVDDLLDDPLRRRAAEREAAGARLLHALLTPKEADFPEHYEFRLFMPDQDGRLLRPKYESGGLDESAGWRPGYGATGTAWSTNSYVRVEDQAVSDGTYGLTSDQQDRYRNLQVVASMPVQNARGAPIGVLTVSSESNDGFLNTPESIHRMLELGQITARVLIDILKEARD